MMIRAMALATCLAAAAMARPAGVDEKSGAVPVRYREGLVHGLLALRSLDGKTLADGDLIQTVRGDRVSARLRFSFRDGSLSDETAVYSQREVFRLETDRLIQRGPSFERSLDMSIDVKAGRVAIKSAGQDETTTMALPDTLANGVLMVLLKNIRTDALPLRLPYLAATPKPRLVTLVVSAGGSDPFSVAGSRRQAMRYVVKVDPGGVAGVLARLFGRLPPDSHVWVLEADAPAFVKSEAPLFYGGPVVRTELASPSWTADPDRQTHRFQDRSR